MRGSSTTLTAAASDCVIHSGTRNKSPAPFGASDDERRHASDRRRPSPASRIVDGKDRRRRPHGPDSRHHDVASERGAERAAIMYTLIQTAKLNEIDPQAWLAGSPTLFPRSPTRRRPGSANSCPGTGCPTAARAPPLNRGPPRRITNPQTVRLEIRCATTVGSARSCLDRRSLM